MIRAMTEYPERDLGTFDFAEYHGLSLTLWRNTSDDPDAPTPDVVFEATRDERGGVLLINSQTGEMSLVHRVSLLKEN